MPSPVTVSMRSRSFRAYDADGRCIGQLRDVWRSRASGIAWGVVHAGRVLRRRRIVPLRGARYGPGRAQLAFGDEVLRTAPVVPVGRALALEHEAALRRHYGL